MNKTSSKAGQREWIGLAVIALPCVLYAMDLTVLNLALPAITKDLKPTGVQQLWIVDIYGFLVAGALIPMGTLGDRIGRRKLLLIGAAVFGAASIVAAFAQTAVMLILTRAFLGFAGATLAPSTLSLIRNMFPNPSERTFAIGVWITSYSVGGAIGPLLGGVLLAHSGWRSVFLLAVPVMILLLAVGPFLLPEYRDPSVKKPDVISAGLSLAAVLNVIYGIKSIAEHGFGWLPLGTIIGGIALGWYFVRRQRALANPLIDLALFQRPAFSASLAIYMLTTLVAFGNFIFISQYLQLVLGLSPIRAAFWMLPTFLGFVVGSMVTPAIVKRIQPGHVMTTAMLVAALGYLLLTQVTPHSPPAVLLTALAVYSLALAPVFTLATDLVVSSAPPAHTGAASAISETSSELGGALGIAILGSAGLAYFRHRMSTVPLESLSPQMAEAARDTLPGALSAALHLGGPAGDALLQQAREAFTQVLHLSAYLCVGILILSALLGRILLKRTIKALP